MPASADLKVKGAVDFIFFCAVNSGQVLSSTAGTLVSASVHDYRQKMSTLKLFQSLVTSRCIGCKLAHFLTLYSIYTFYNDSEWTVEHIKKST